MNDWTERDPKVNEACGDGTLEFLDVPESCEGWTVRQCNQFPGRVHEYLDAAKAIQHKLGESLCNHA